MSSSNEQGPKQDWFDKLPKKLRIILLMLFTSATSAVFFFFGLHAYRTGEYSDYAGHQDSAVTDFVWCLFWLAITALLFAAYLEWFDRRKDDSPK